MSGGGIGGTLGSLAGAALAPETGGLSLAIPAITGAGGAFLGGKLTGDKNPLLDAVLCGIGGGISGYFDSGSSLSNSAGLWDSGATGASGVIPDGLQSAVGEGSPMVGADFQNFLDETPVTEGGNLGAPEGSNIAGGSSILPSSVPSANNSSNNTQQPTSLLSQLGSYASKNPLQTALAGNIGLATVQSLLPNKRVNIGQNAANVLATNPNFNAQLPKYNLQNTASPYTGNWYTYGQTPQTPLYNAQPQLAKRGGVIGYAQGGHVNRYAQGGSPMASPLTGI